MLLSCLLLLLSTNSLAQKLYFTDTSNKWRVEIIPGDFPPSDHIFSYLPVDTVLNGTSYHIIAFNGLNLIREDTVQRKVFARTFGGSFQDTTERVLYDYNRSLGDTVVTYRLNDTCYHILDAIDSVVINGVWHRVQNYIPMSFVFGDAYQVIEGVGCLTNPIFPLFPKTFEPAYNFKCFTSKQSIPVITYPAGSTFNNGCTVGIKSLSHESGIVLYPNPATDNLYLTVSGHNPGSRFILFDSFGRKIKERIISQSGELTIGVSDLPDGLYCYRFVMSGKPAVTGKIIVAH